MAWAHDHLEWRPGEGLTPYQEEILDAIPKKRRVAVRGPHGLGKTMLSSVAVSWFSDIREGFDWKIITTASAWRQLTKYLWPEIHKWTRRIKWDRVGRKPYNLRHELMSTSLKLRTGEATAVASNNFEFIEGAHADYLLYVFDEAKAIPERTFDAAEGAFSGAGEDTAVEAYALAISTPGEPVGRFHAIHARKKGYEDWWPRHVTLDEAIAAKRISRQWAEQRCAQWGESSVLYLNRVLGEFGTSESEGVVPYGWLLQAQERYPEDAPEAPELVVV